MVDAALQVAGATSAHFLSHPHDDKLITMVVANKTEVEEVNIKYYIVCGKYFAEDDFVCPTNMNAISLQSHRSTALSSLDYFRQCAKDLMPAHPVIPSLTQKREEKRSLTSPLNKQSNCDQL